MEKKKKGHGCLITVIIMFVLFGLFGIIVNNGVKDVKNNPQKYDDSIFAKFIDVTTDESKVIDDILIQCGITSAKSITHDELLDNAHIEGETGYRIAISDSVDNIILYLSADNTVTMIRYADYDLYNNDSVIATLDDYTVSKDELDKYQYLCQEKVKEVLKSPSTAKFPNYTEWGWKQEKNLFYAQGYVDSENSFGATVRSQFEFTIDMSTNTIQSLIFDGQEIISQ